MGHAPRLLSRGEKGMLVQRFADLVADPSRDVDRQIDQIRRRLADQFGPDFDFYWTIPVMAMWKPAQNAWASFIYWAGEFRDSAEFDASERDYKLALAEALTPARRVVLASEGDWCDPLTAALRSKENNLIGWRETDRFVKWAISDPKAGLEALRAIWQAAAEPAAAMAAFHERLPRDTVSTPGQRVSIGSVLLMNGDPFAVRPIDRPVKVKGTAEHWRSTARSRYSLLIDVRASTRTRYQQTKSPSGSVRGQPFRPVSRSETVYRAAV